MWEGAADEISNGGQLLCSAVGWAGQGQHSRWWADCCAWRVCSDRYRQAQKGARAEVAGRVMGGWGPCRQKTDGSAVLVARRNSLGFGS